MRRPTAYPGIVAIAIAITGCSLPFLHDDEADRRPTRFEQFEIADDRMSVRVDFVGAADVCRELNRRKFLCDHRPAAGIRIAPHFYNSEAEIDFAIDAIEDILGAGR